MASCYISTGYTLDWFYSPIKIGWIAGNSGDRQSAAKPPKRIKVGGRFND